MKHPPQPDESDINAPIHCISCNVELGDNDDCQQYDDEVYCQECFDEQFDFCEICEEHHSTDDSHLTHDIVVCQACYTSNFTTCSDCSQEVDKRHPTNDVYIEGSNRWICQHCYEENYDMCDNCNEIVRQTYELPHEGNYCEYCLVDHYTSHSNDSFSILDQFFYTLEKDIDISEDNIEYELLDEHKAMITTLSNHTFTDIPRSKRELLKNWLLYGICYSEGDDYYSYYSLNQLNLMIKNNEHWEMHLRFYVRYIDMLDLTPDQYITLNKYRTINQENELPIVI